LGKSGKRDGEQTMSKGSWQRLDARRTVESVLGLDIRSLHREGLRPGNRALVGWFGGWGDASVRVEYIDPDHVCIASLRDGQVVLEQVTLERTTCNYGGHRPWWNCPDCGRRCALLYLVGEHFRCRCCGELTYRTSQLSPWARTARKSVGLGRRMGWEIGSTRLTKPSGMHGRTFERRVAEYASACQTAFGPPRPAFEPDNASEREA
jgi:hypothetical protein